MSNITKLTQTDKLDLCFAASAAVQFTIENWYSIMNIASRLCNGDPGAAFRDIMEKGVLELEKICEMDEDVCKQTEEIVTIKPRKEVWRE